MKVYLEEKDIGRKIVTYNDWQNTQQGLYVFGKDKIEVLSLADYTKQVRKEVLDQVYNVFTTEDVWSELKSWWLQSGTCEELKACLDAMVEETSVENIVKKFGHHRNFYQMLDQIQGVEDEQTDN